jgi:hypothetical protein
MREIKGIQEMEERFETLEHYNSWAIDRIKIT